MRLYVKLLAQCSDAHGKVRKWSSIFFLVLILCKTALVSCAGSCLTLTEFMKITNVLWSEKDLGHLRKLNQKIKPNGVVEAFGV